MTLGLERLSLIDFRPFRDVVFEPDPKGTTLIIGPNGSGKTSLLEAVGYLSTQRSFRGALRPAMIRGSCERSILRGQFNTHGRSMLIESELNTSGISKTLVNRQPLRSADTPVAVTVFSPSDLTLVQGAPVERRRALADALCVLGRKEAALVSDVDRVIRHRTALLRQARGVLSKEVEMTLDVWDQRLATSGTLLAEAREELVEAFRPHASAAYQRLVSSSEPNPVQKPDPVRNEVGPTTRGVIGLVYQRSWEGDLLDALGSKRKEDLKRAVTSVGPHRDDLAMAIDGRDARSQASQGEQRCLALAVRLALHRLITERTGNAPILLLDDVFSELDLDRSRALVAQIPEGQALVTTAVPLPDGIEVALTVDVRTLEA